MMMMMMMMVMVIMLLLLLMMMMMRLQPDADSILESRASRQELSFTVTQARFGWDVRANALLWLYLGVSQLVVSIYLVARAGRIQDRHFVAVSPTAIAGAHRTHNLVLHTKGLMAIVGDCCR
jgi:hypothetical protein